MQKDTKRNFALDVLRVLACYMVIQVHTGEFYYIGPVGDVIKGENAFWVDLYNSVCRSAVPLFVMLTGYFLLPVKDEPAPILPQTLHACSHTFYILVHRLLFLSVLPRTSGLCNALYEYPQNPGKLRDTSGASVVRIYADGTVSLRSYHFALVKNGFAKEHRAISWDMGVYFVRALYPSGISGYIRGMFLERDSDVILFLRVAGIYGIGLLSADICFGTEKLEPAGRHRFIGSGLFHHLVWFPRTVIDSRIRPATGNHLGIRDYQRSNGGNGHFPVDQEYPDQEPGFSLRKVSYGYID